MSILNSRKRGNGKPVVFIHGFPMTQDVWDDFGERFVDTNSVITIDLPGFGRSENPSSFYLDHIADHVIRHILENEIIDSVIVGHSLGGYVALAMVEKRPDLFSGMTLFHSTAYADSTEKKQSRDKVIEFVEKNGALPFTMNFITPLFANPQHKSIETVRKIAASASADAVIGYTKAMRDRRDQIKTLKKFEKPTLFLAGEKDSGIPVESVLEQAVYCQQSDVHVLRNVAHMGMFENPDKASSKIKGFLAQI